MKRYVFDIETDNLLPKLTTFHCAGIKDYETGEEFFFRPKEFKPFLDKLDEADVIVAHNAWGFDVPALMKLDPTWKPKGKVTCTKVMSQVLNYNRFSSEDKQYHRYLKIREKKLLSGDKSVKKVVQGMGHSLARWGIHLGDYKGDFTEFEIFTQEMFEYLKQDVRLGHKVYSSLMKELSECCNTSSITYSKYNWGRVIPNSETKIKVQGRDILKALEVEHEIERIMTEETQNGWTIDTSKIDVIKKMLSDKIDEISVEVNKVLLTYVGSPGVSGTQLALLREEIQAAKESKLPVEEWPEVKPVDKVFTMKGKLNSNVARYFGLPADTAIDDSPVWGPYTKVDFSKGDVGNTDQVKDYLTTIGWEPDEWNWKKEGKEFVKKSSKLSESSLEPFGIIGQHINEFYTLRSRFSIINGWDEHIDKNSRLHGDVFNIGTPTFRQTHNIIANLPSGSAFLGPEIRGAFVAEKGKVLVSADSAACQLRLLAHFMGDPVFTREVCEGDVHALNASIIECERPQAKRFIFAYLYGAGAPKLSTYIGKTVEETKEAILRYKRKLPKLAELVDQVNNQVESNGYVLGLDNRKLCLNKQERHKALNYLIQGAEAVVMKATVVMLDRRLKEAGIEFNHLLFYHDEHTVEARKDQAEQAREIIMQSFIDAPKAYGIDIMTCGDCKIGKDYYEVH